MIDLSLMITLVKSKAEMLKSLRAIGMYNFDLCLLYVLQVYSEYGY